MGSKRIGNNNSSQDALLRSVKNQAVAIKLDGSLKPNEKALAESILSVIFQKLEASDEYALKLVSKNTDATLGRIASLLDEINKNYSSAELANVKDAIINAVNDASSNENADSSESADIGSLLQNMQQCIDGSLQERLDETVTQLKTDFTTSQNASQTKIDESITQLKDGIDSNQSKLEKKIEDSGSQQSESSDKEPAVDLEEFVAKTDEEAFNEEDLNQIQEFINQQFTLLTGLITNVADQLNKNIEAVTNAITSLQNNLNENINSLKPSNKDKKAAKAAKSAQKRLTEIIERMDKAVAKIEGFIDNFVKVLIANFATFMNGVFKVLFVFFLKLMLGIVIPFLLVVGLALYLLKDPLMEILQPIMDFVERMFDKLLTFLAPIRDFIIRTLEDAWKSIVKPFLVWITNAFMKFADNVLIPLFETIASVLKEFFLAIKPWIRPIVNIIFKILKTFLEAIQPWIVPIVDTIFRILQKLLEAIEPWIEPLVNVIMATLIEIMETIKTVVQILNEFLKGFKENAFAIGDAVGKVVLAVVKVVEKIVKLFEEVTDILINIAKIINAPIKFVADFFDGFNTNAKKIGEKVSEIALVVADIILKILKALDGAITGIRRFMMQYIVAPLNGLRRWINAKFTSLMNSIWVPTFSWGDDSGSSTCVGKLWDRISGLSVNKYYVFLDKEVPWGSDSGVADPPDANKSVSELINEEMESMEKKLQEEEAAAKQAEVTRALERKKIEEMLDNVKLMENMSKQVEEMYNDFKDPNNKKKIDFSEIITALNEKTDAIKNSIVEMQASLQKMIEEKLASNEMFDKLFKDIQDLAINCVNKIIEVTVDIANSVREEFFGILDAIYRQSEKMFEMQQEMLEAVVSIKESFDEILEIVRQLPTQEWFEQKIEEIIPIAEENIAKIDDIQQMSYDTLDKVQLLDDVLDLLDETYYIADQTLEMTHLLKEKFDEMRVLVDEIHFSTVNKDGILRYLGYIYYDFLSPLIRYIWAPFIEKFVEIFRKISTPYESFFLMIGSWVQALGATIFPGIQNFVNWFAARQNDVNTFFEKMGLWTSTLVDTIFPGIQNFIGWFFGRQSDIDAALDDALSMNDTSKTNVSKQTSFSAWSSLLNIEKSDKAKTEAINTDGMSNPADDIKDQNKKNAKAQGKFQTMLMEFLEQKFGEVLEKLDDDQGIQALPIPITFNANNPASLENI